MDREERMYLRRQTRKKGGVEYEWALVASVLVLARFCAPSSELQITESWCAKTALDDLLAIPEEKINDDRLYFTCQPEHSQGALSNAR
jgi:hypothetical protein